MSEILKSILPVSVDLRSDYEQVYNQGQDGSCGAHAATACLDCVYERATGIKHRFDKAYIWKWSKFYNNIPDSMNTGVDQPSLKKALEQEGALLDNGTIVKGLKLASTRPINSEYVKRMLALGYPMIYVMRMPLNIASLYGDWKQHELVLDKSGSQERFHFVAIVGYDDTAQRFLLENSWGSNWGDNGWFGVHYSQVFDPNLFCGMNHFEILPVLPKPYNNWRDMSNAPYIYILPTEQQTFFDKVQPALKQMLMQALEQEGVPAVIAKCKQFAISDKFLELMMGWQRGTVRAFKVSNPDFNWDGFIWDQI